VSANVLGRIVAATRESVSRRTREFPIERVLSQAPTPGARRAFGGALRQQERVNVIAEFKRRSPSRGVIREDLPPVAVAQAYEVAGAAALSVLTDHQFFGGSLQDLQEARAATLLPTLRKDFVVDAYQVREAWIAGADAVLLIAAVLDDAELRALHKLAVEHGLDPLVEVHDGRELARALAAGATLIGVNSRDLRTMEVRLETALELAPLVPDEVVAVAESGIRSGRDLRRLRDAGYDAFLVGEQLMQAKDPGRALEELLREAREAVA
jgi:indole-3-glycerol phosphate synthase